MTLINSDLQTIYDLAGDMIDSGKKVQAAATALDAKLNPPWSLFSNAQLLMPEKETDGSLGIWYRARNRTSPQTGPHGTIHVTLGNSTLITFDPIATSGWSDNVYCLARVYSFLNAVDRQRLDEAKKLKLHVGWEVDLAQNVQALECEAQFRRTNGDLVNFSLQWLPDGSLRAYDYHGTQGWVYLDAKQPMLSNQSADFVVEAEIINDALCYRKLNGGALTWSHPIVHDVACSPYLNLAYQLDGKSSGVPYTAKVSNLEVAWQ